MTGKIGKQVRMSYVTSSLSHQVGFHLISGSVHKECYCNRGESDGKEHGQ